MVDISFIILTWNSYRFLTKCFSSIIEKCQDENLTFEIIVVDNGSTDESQTVFSAFKAEYPDQFMVEYLGRNTGTTYSRNIGINKSKGQTLCILDSDTELHEGNLADIIDRLREQKDLGLIIPQLFLQDKTIQNSVKKFPTFWHKLLKIPQVALGLKSPNKDFYSDFPFEQEKLVDTAISACWFFRRELVDSVGYLDEKIFYSPEDLDFCVRVRKAGLKILYWPAMRVFHDTQHISHKKPFSKVSRSHFVGLIYYFRKHGGWFSNSHLYS
ncbi:glycosyltransferase family 2 protein [Geopsychrobacter electrodiphilus]|uniref:glycosyltransferase family 2 protein n=1 Tax=Geopsychrobacter electrodiphilus TaxID=225196 RepID=UPI0003779AB8|nr:glycosyltransferase [Geopsychrobacter electrodiphilus]